MPTILIGTGRDRGQRFEFDDAVTLGRAPENQVRLVDNQISRFHARLEPDGDGWVVVDLGSRNGVRVNGAPVERATLHEGDSFVIGSITVVFEPPEGLEVDPAGTGVLVQLESAPLSPGSRRTRSLAPASVDPSETLDLSSLVVARERLEAVVDVYALLGRERDPHELALSLARRVREALSALAVVVFGSARAEQDMPPVLGTSAPEECSPIAVSRELLEDVGQVREAVLGEVELPQAPAVAVEGDEPAGVTGVGDDPERVSVMAAPLVSAGQLVGILALSRRIDVPFTEADLDLLCLFATQSGSSLGSAIGHRHTLEANRALREQVHDRLSIIGESPALLEIVGQAKRAARGDSTVLVRGETGTGKELIARLVHEASPRYQQPFVAVNCAAIVEGLLESELFGHERGAFTGADRQKKGQLELANGGTFFLDEVGDMDLRTQKKLLRVLEERRFSRVGGTRLIAVDVRLVAATNRDLERDVEEGSFRRDLYYRLSVIPLQLPPLRERRGDIRPLLDHYLTYFGGEMGRRVTRVDPAALDLLERYSWPGNIRELKNVIERAIVLGSGDTLGIDDLPPELRGAGADRGRLAGRLDDELKLADAIAALERDCIERARDRTGGNKSESCRLLGISRPTLDRKIRDLEIDWNRTD